MTRMLNCCSSFLPFTDEKPEYLLWESGEGTYYFKPRESQRVRVDVQDFLSSPASISSTSTTPWPEVPDQLHSSLRVSVLVVIVLFHLLFSLAFFSISFQSPPPVPLPPSFSTVTVEEVVENASTATSVFLSFCNANDFCSWMSSSKTKSTKKLHLFQKEGLRQQIIITMEKRREARGELQSNGMWVKERIE